MDKQPRTPSENANRIRKIAAEVVRTYGRLPAEEAAEVVKLVCWRELGPAGYNSAVVRWAVESVQGADPETPG